MILKGWNAKLHLLRETRRGLRLSIKSRATSSNDLSSFTIRLRGTASGTTSFVISITASVSDNPENLKSYSITCKGTIWRRTRSRSSWKWRVGFQKLEQRETRFTPPPFLTHDWPSTTTTGAPFIPTEDTPGIEWLHSEMSEPRIPD